MNEEEKKEEQKLIDLGDGRFIDQTHFLTLLDQNKQKYADRWTLKGRQNEVLDSINNFRQQIVDGNITGRKANTNWLIKPGFENTKWDEFARGFANELISQAPSDSILFAKPKSKEEPKEEPKKYDTSFQSAFNNQYGRMDSWRAKGYDELTGVWNEEPLIEQMQDLAIQHKAQNVGKGLDFTGSRYADEADFIKVMDEISRATTVDDMVRLMGRTGWEENVDDLGATYFGRVRKTQPAQPAQPAQTQKQIDAEEDDAAWRDFFETNYVVPFENHRLPNDFRLGTQHRLSVGYENDPNGYQEKVGSVWVALNNLQQNNPHNLQLQQKDILGLYSDYFNTEGYKENFKEDKDGFYYHNDFVVPHTGGDGDYGYYVSFNPRSNTIRFNYIKNNPEILKALRDEFIKNRVDERDLKRMHYKEKGGIIKMLRGGNTKPDSTHYYSIIGTRTPISLEAVLGSTPQETPASNIEKALEAEKKQQKNARQNEQDARDEFTYAELMSYADRRDKLTEKELNRLRLIEGFHYNAAVGDLVSLIASMTDSPWFDAVATGRGMASAVGRGVANTLDKGTPWYSDLGKFALDFGGEALTMVPWFGTTGKLGKAQKAAATIINYLGTGAAVGNLAYLSIAEQERLKLALGKVLNGRIQDLNSEDIQTISSLLGSSLALGRKGVQGYRQHNHVKDGKLTSKMVDKQKSILHTPRQDRPKMNNIDEKYARQIARWSESSTKPVQPKANNVKTNNEKPNSWLHLFDKLNAYKATKAAEQAFNNRIDFYGGKHRQMVDDWVKFGGTTKQLEDAAHKLQQSGLVQNEMEALEYLYEQLKNKTVPNHVILELDQLLTPSNKNGGKLSQMKALRKGGVLKAEQGLQFDENELNYFKSLGIDPNKKYSTIYDFRNSDDYLHYLASDFNQNQDLKTQANESIQQTVNPINLGSSGTGNAGTWRHVNSGRYFNGTSYNDQATKDFHTALDNMNPVKRQQGFGALKAAGDNTELWNQTFQQHFGDINNNIVGYNPEVDNYNGVSTQFRQESIDSYKPAPPKLVTVDDVNTKVGLDLPEKLTMPEVATKAREQEMEEVGARVKQGEQNTQPQYLKVNENANAIGRYINQLRGAQRQHDLQEQALIDGKRRLVKEVIPTREIRNDFGFTPYDQAMTDINNRLNDPNLTPQERSQLYNQYSQLEVQKGAYQSQRTDMSTQQKFEDVSKQASIDHKYAQEQSDIDSALAYSLGMNDVKLNNDTTSLGESLATQMHLNNQNYVTGYNKAVMNNAIASKKADLNSAITYANQYYSNDPAKWQAHVNPAQNAYDQAHIDESNRYWGIEPKVDSAYNFNLKQRKSGGKLDKKEIESLKFLSKQIETQTKSRDRGLDRLSKVTYKTILKSLGLI